MNDANRSIGLFDSGVGGLTVFQAVERALPAERLVYLGDTARVPYGTRSAQTVRRYADEAGRFLGAHGLKALVVACNSAASVALDTLRHRLDLPVFGVIGPGARRAAGISRSGRIGVIGTRATVASGAYESAIRKVRPDAEVLSRACPLFVPLAEEGWTSGAVARETAATYLAPLVEAQVDTLVLGCTHYPLLRETIGDVMGDGVKLVDSAESLALEIRERLEREGVAAADRHDEHRFFVTDVPGPFQQVAERFLGRPIGRLEQVALEGDPSDVTT